MTIRPELIDELLKDCADPREVRAAGGLLKQLTKAIIERCLETELDAHLGYPKHGRREEGSANARNGRSRKTLKGAQGEIEITVPRDRQASFEPQFIQKHQTRFEGFEDKILALYARGMTTRDIQAQVQDLYGVEVSPTFISNITEAVMEEVRQWQNRPLDAVYPIVYVDCLVVKVRENQRVLNKALYLALGVDMEGQKELLGMWMSQNEGARILAGGVHRTAKPWPQRYLHRLYGWTHRPSRSRRDTLPADARATLSGAYGAQLAQICLLQTSQRGGSRLEAGLRRGD
jgi:putative transposase